MPLTRWERKALLPHGTCTRIAAELGVSRGMVSNVLAERRFNARVRAALAEAMGLPQEMAFARPPETVAVSDTRAA